MVPIVFVKNFSINMFFDENAFSTRATGTVRRFAFVQIHDFVFEAHYWK